MLAVPLVIAPIAFVGGLYLSARFARPRAEGIAARVIDLLVGAAAVVFALNAYVAVRAATSDIYDGFDRGDAIADILIDTFWQGGVLIAAATVVHLLAHRRDAPPPQT